MLKRHRYVIVLVSLAGMALALQGSSAAGVSRHAERPPCELLDEAQGRAMTSATAEWVLRGLCGQEREPVAPRKGPVRADVPPVGVDVRVNDIDPPASSTIQSETSLAVSSSTGTLCATFNDAYHWPSQGLAGFSRSTDGGLTWQDGGPFPPAPGGVSWGDPSVVWRRADEHFYFTSMVGTSQDRIGLGLWRSTDECATFEWVGMVHVGNDDKELMAVDNNPASPFYGRFYIAWTDLGVPRRLRLTTSDDGTVWSGPVDLTTGITTVGAWPAVAPNGDLYVVWLHWVIYDTTISIEGARSTDGGTTVFPIANPLTEAVAPRDAQASATCGRPALKANAGDGIRYYAMPQVAVGPDGCLHAVYSYDPDGFNTGDVVDAFYRRSCDQGATWEPERRLHDDAGLTDQFFPAVAVSEDNVVVAAWYDRRLDPVDNYLVDRYWSLSYDGGTTWEPNARVSDVSSPVYTSSCYHGDYDQMATLGRSVYHVWSDDRIYFNGHYDPDIWFDQALVPPADFTLAALPAAHDVCRPAVVTSTVQVGSFLGYNQPVLLSDSGAPEGVDTSFDPDYVFPLPGEAVYALDVTTTAPHGTHPLTITAQSPSLTHSVTVTLVISDCGCDLVQDAALSWEPLMPMAGALVTFTGEATGTLPITLTWDVGGTPTAGPVVTHSFDLPGDYAVTMTATNPCSAEVITDAVTVLPACAPISGAAFTWQPVTPTAGAPITFTGEATGTAPITITWAFGDGGSGMGVVVTHTYALSGTYPVVMTAANPCGLAMVEQGVDVAPAEVSHRVYLPLVVRE